MPGKNEVPATRNESVIRMEPGGMKELLVRDEIDSPRNEE